MYQQLQKAVHGRRGGEGADEGALLAMRIIQNRHSRRDTIDTTRKLPFSSGEISGGSLTRTVKNSCE